MEGKVAHVPIRSVEFVRGAVETRLDRGKWLSENPARILDMAEAGVEIGHGAPSVPSIKKTR